MDDESLGLHPGVGSHSEDKISQSVDVSAETYVSSGFINSIMSSNSFSKWWKILPFDFSFLL